MLVACVRVCVWMDKCLQRSNAGKKRKRWQVAGSFASYHLLLAHKPLQEFFFLKENRIFIEEVVYFTLIYFAH